MEDKIRHQLSKKWNKTLDKDKNVYVICYISGSFKSF